MPIYEYACEACKNHFEAWQRMSEAPVERCPACQSKSVRRVISLSSFSLKGTGWYATDYKRKSSSSSGE